MIDMQHVRSRNEPSRNTFTTVLNWTSIDVGASIAESKNGTSVLKGAQGGYES